MNSLAKPLRDLETHGPALRPWFVLFACATLAVALIAGSQRATTAQSALSGPTTPTAPTAMPAPSDRPPTTRSEFAPTFADAAESLRTGRYADAYGRFVRLADEGDIEAARIALVMHALGPRAFGSSWDATVEQLIEWTQWSEASAKEDLARLRATLHGRSDIPIGRDPPLQSAVSIKGPAR
jgi:hypothetical protein